MKPFQSILLFVLLTIVLAACGPQATPVTLQFENPYAPQSGDSDLATGEITVDSSSVYIAESYPPQLMVSFSYFQPTPCHQLRIEVTGPNNDNQIDLKAYAVTEKDKPCSLMALATPLQASLNLGSLPKGQYTVLLNGDQIGGFEWE